jgi:F-type H+-transporting ATPase subunit gamma
MATLRELRDRIKSVNSTKKITKAQELIATSKITKAQARVTASQPYADEITRVIQRLASASSLDHPMLDTEAEARRAAILVITSDRGMCGGYNHNVLKTTVELRKKLQNEGKDVVLYIAGSKGVDYFNFRSEPLAGAWTGFSQDPEFKLTHQLRQPHEPANTTRYTSRTDPGPPTPRDSSTRLQTHTQGSLENPHAKRDRKHGRGLPTSYRQNTSKRSTPA